MIKLVVDDDDDDPTFAAHIVIITPKKQNDGAIKVQTVETITIVGTCQMRMLLGPHYWKSTSPKSFLPGASRIVTRHLRHQGMVCHRSQNCG
eukprot:594228-Amphidinium_carterae.1